MSDPLRLTELVTVRVLHDIGGLAATRAATIELALDEAGAGGESLTSAADLTAELNRRVRLLRSAWGRRERRWTLRACRIWPLARRARIACGLISRRCRESACFPRR